MALKVAEAKMRAKDEISKADNAEKEADEAKRLASKAQAEANEAEAQMLRVRDQHADSLAAQQAAAAAAANEQKTKADLRAQELVPPAPAAPAAPEVSPLDAAQEVNADQ